MELRHARKAPAVAFGRANLKDLIVYGGRDANGDLVDFAEIINLDTR